VSLVPEADAVAPVTWREVFAVPPMDNRTLRPRPAPARTLFWLGVVDGTWSNLGNWFVDQSGSSLATRFPTSRDTVVVSGTLDGEPTTPPVVANLVVVGTLVVSLTVTGAATFNGTAQFGAGVTLFGNATFNDTSVLLGDVVGNASFAPTATQCGGVTGTVSGTPLPCP
jgi:hypothetical protein